jgi:hypothetical protein
MPAERAPAPRFLSKRARAHFVCFPTAHFAEKRRPRGRTNRRQRSEARPPTSQEEEDKKKKDVSAKPATVAAAAQQ